MPESDAVMLDTIIGLFMLVSPSATNYDKVVQTLQQIEAQNPAAAQVITIGVNDQGVPIQGLKIGDGPVASLVVGTHHGNEYGSTAVALGVAESFAKNPIEGQTVYVIPVLNISGYNRNSRFETGVKGSQDPNRDYAGPCKKGAVFNLKSTKALAEFLDAKEIQISATLHTYWPAVTYPWGISTRDTDIPQRAQYIELAKAATQESNYQVGNSTQLLYAADGAFEDYAYWRHGIWSLLFELGFTHSPNPSAVKTMIEVNVPGIRRFLESSPKQRVADHLFTGQCDRGVLQRLVLE